MNGKSPSLILNKLVLVGTRKNYIVPFHNGLNIIYGDSDTGKSSILNLINYCLGSKNVDMYNELEFSCKYCMLEVKLNGKVYTIKRNLFNSNELVEVYYSNIDEMEDVFPYRYSPNYNKEGKEGYLSDFFLKALNIPLIKIKQAPSKVDSELVRLSFRDIFKFCYLDQDDIGSKYVLDIKNGSVFTKNKETFKFIYNVLDSQIAELEGNISEKQKEKRGLEKRYSIISSFLRETEIKSLDVLNAELEDIDEQFICIKSEIDKLNQEMKGNLTYNNELRLIIEDLNCKIQQKQHARNLVAIELEQNVKLKREYDKDIIKLKSSIEVGEKLPNNSEEVKCPVCHKKIMLNELKECLDDNDVEHLKNEVKALKRRKNNLSNLIDEENNKISLLSMEIEEARGDLNRAENLLDKNTSEYISPYVSQRDGLVSERTSLNEKKDKINYFIKLRKQVDLINDDIKIFETQISDLNINIEELRANAPSTSDIVSTLSDYLSDFLKFIKIKNPTDISISNKNFLPIVRGKEYIKITSGGLRTLTSMGYFISLLRKSLECDTNLPRFLMLDTIGKYIGKTKEKYLEQTDMSQDIKEGIDDPDKYLNIYNYFIDMCSFYEEKEGDFDYQIIIVDNEIPEKIEKVIDKYYIKRFSSDGKKGFDIGLIDDIY